MADDAARPSSQEYLEQLRARRAARAVSDASDIAATPNNQDTTTVFEPSTPATLPPTTTDTYTDPEPVPSEPEHATSTIPLRTAEIPAIQQPTQKPLNETPNQTERQSELPPSASHNNPDVQDIESGLFPGQIKPLPETDVYQWTAPTRAFKKRNRQFYVTVGLITFLISLILFFAGQFLPIAVVIAVAFLAYVLSSVPPEMIINKITTYGLRTDNHLYFWEELGRFWFEQKFGQDMVVVEIDRFPGRISLLIPEGKKEAIKLILSEVLLEQKPPETFIDKSASWLQDKIPLELN